MTRVTTTGSAYVVVDVCSAHGTWFDKNELRVLLVARIANVQLTSSRMHYAWPGSLEDGFDH